MMPAAGLAQGVADDDPCAAHDTKGYGWCYNLGLPNLMLLDAALGRPDQPAIHDNHAG